jgi:hypothetical protein
MRSFFFLGATAVALLAHGCSDDETNGNTGSGPGATSTNGSSGSGAGSTTGSTGGSGGGDGTSLDACPVGEAFCIAHDTRRACVGAPGGAEYADELCAAGSGCVQGECVVNSCSDECTLGTTGPAQETCEAWDMLAGTWTTTDQAGSMHDRSREYLHWMRRDNMLYGGVGDARYSDPPTYSNVTALSGVGDSAIWTGTYLAAESLRLVATGALDARNHVKETVNTLHLWFNVAGDAGLLSRFVKPSAEVLPYTVADIDCSATRVFCNVDYQGTEYDYTGHISRDQYQGVMLGYSLAYDALPAEDEAARELIREDVVELVEELMMERTVPMSITVNGTTAPTFDATMRFVVLASREMNNGAVEVTLDTNDTDASVMTGFQEFMPNLGDLAGQIPVVGATLGYIPRSDSAVMLSSFFHVALQVTEGVPAYAARRAAIEDFFLNNSGLGGNVGDWLDIAKIANDDQQCGNGYYANNIVMEPLYNLARLETDAGRLQIIRDDVLGGWLWNKLAITKNSFFSFIYASNVPSHDPAVVSSAAAQLSGFPEPPRAKRAIDLLADAKYMPHHATCTNQTDHSVAVDVADRTWADFMWQRHPWGLFDLEDLGRVAPGVDYQVAYWMGRRHDFISDDTPNKCLRWK